jgi:copper homeostasis protein
MKRTFILEIAVESTSAALAAERGGADRIELCSELGVGGLTPSAEAMREARSAVRLPIHAMIRPSGGNFVYNSEEFSGMKASIELAREIGMDGVVLGVLRTNNTVDVQRTKELIDFARPMPVTFHRAFEECVDLPGALEDVIDCGATRILSSGGARNVPEGLVYLQALLRSAGDRIVIIPGGGIQPGNFSEVRSALDAKEYHSGLGTVIPYGAEDWLDFEAAVRELRDAGENKFRD